MRTMIRYKGTVFFGFLSFLSCAKREAKQADNTVANHPKKLCHNDTRRPKPFGSSSVRTNTLTA